MTCYWNAWHWHGIPCHGGGFGWWKQGLWGDWLGASDEALGHFTATLPCNVKTSIPPQLSPTIVATFYLLKIWLVLTFLEPLLWLSATPVGATGGITEADSPIQPLPYSASPQKSVLHQPCRRYLLLSTRAAIPAKEVGLLEFLLVLLQVVRLTDTSILSTLFAAHIPRKLNEAFTKAFPCWGLVIVAIKGLRVHISISHFQSLSVDSGHENSNSLPQLLLHLWRDFSVRLTGALRFAGLFGFLWCRSSGSCHPAVASPIFSN